jgi:hypothetical protein
VTTLRIGHARVSTDDQDLTAKRDALAALGVALERVYVDHGLTGTNRDPPGCTPSRRQMVPAYLRPAERVHSGAYQPSRINHVSTSLARGRSVRDPLFRSVSSGSADWWP